MSLNLDPNNVKKKTTETKEEQPKKKQILIQIKLVLKIK